MDLATKLAPGLELSLYRQKMLQQRINFDLTNFARIMRLNMKP